jgi:hypothetical protein
MQASTPSQEYKSNMNAFSAGAKLQQLNGCRQLLQQPGLPL